MVKVKKHICKICQSRLIFLKTNADNKHLFYCLSCKLSFKKNNLFILNKKNNLHIK
jgi:hypothetical protein